MIAPRASLALSTNRLAGLLQATLLNPGFLGYPLMIARLRSLRYQSPTLMPSPF